jgi:hypothetical protein
VVLTRPLNLYASGCLYRRSIATYRLPRILTVYCRADGESTPEVLNQVDSDLGKYLIQISYFRVEELANKKGVGVAQISVTWLLSRDGTRDIYILSIADTRYGLRFRLLAQL